MHRLIFGFLAKSYLIPISFFPGKLSVPASDVLCGEAANYRFEGCHFLHQPHPGQYIFAFAQENEGAA